MTHILLNGCGYDNPYKNKLHDVSPIGVLYKPMQQKTIKHDIGPLKEGQAVTGMVDFGLYILAKVEETDKNYIVRKSDFT